MIFSETFSAVASDPLLDLGAGNTSERWAGTRYGPDPVDLAGRWQFFENTFLALNPATQDKAVLFNEEQAPVNAGVAIKTPGIPVVPGRAYTLSFEHWGDNSPGTYSLGVQIDSTIIGVVTRPFTATGAGAFMTTLLPFVAPDNEIIVTFTDMTLASASSGIIDNIVISVIPEPETYALLLAGLFLLAFRRRRQS